MFIVSALFGFFPRKSASQISAGEHFIEVLFYESSHDRLQKVHALEQMLSRWFLIHSY